MISTALPIIASKLPPQRTGRTYFNSGRSAFSFLIGSVIRPRIVHLPTYTCWSLVSAMQRRFPHIEVRFYPVQRDLHCNFPRELDRDETLVFMHYFGYENRQAIPAGDGVTLEDVSHSFLSQIQRRGTYIFGSLRKVARVGDGGFLDHPFNPQYEPSKKLDTWLRYEARDWRDMREAENMIDRDWQISDISSQSLAVILALNPQKAKDARLRNDRILHEQLRVGRPLRAYANHESPLLHQRLFDSTKDRDELRSFLASRNIFCSIHWPTHPSVLASDIDISDTLWLESHSLAIPVSHEYDERAMERVVLATDEWAQAGT
jgi:hypothetical protein